MMEVLKKTLLEMAARDLALRSDLIGKGILSDGYHPEMEQLHNAHAERLSEIIDKYGWPTAELVGREAAAAAWLIVQHAISKPTFQKRCLEILKNEVVQGKAEPKDFAYLQDRILVFEGKPQIYGTQFDWDTHGELNPLPIRDLNEVDTLRKNVGLPALTDAISQIRQRSVQEGEKPPLDFEKKKGAFILWAKKVGWRT